MRVPGLECLARSQDEDDLSGRLAPFERAVGFGRIGERIASPDPYVQSARQYGLVQLPCAPAELLRGGHVEAERRPGDEQRAGRVEPLQIERGDLAAGAAEEHHHSARLEARE